LRDTVCAERLTHRSWRENWLTHRQTHSFGSGVAYITPNVHTRIVKAENNYVQYRKQLNKHGKTYRSSYFLFI